MTTAAAVRVALLALLVVGAASFDWCDVCKASHCKIPYCSDYCPDDCPPGPPGPSAENVDVDCDICADPEVNCVFDECKLACVDVCGSVEIEDIPVS